MERIKHLMKTMKQEFTFFPSELSGQPLITVKGNRQFIIENTYLLKSYTINKISMVSANQTIEIKGEDIKITAMYKEELIVEGILTSIQFNEIKEEL